MIQASTKLAAVLATAAAVAAGVPGPAASAHRPAPIRATAAKSCSHGYKRGVINGSVKCLRRGEFCAHSADSQYRRYGFRCTRWYSNVQRYRLT